MLLTRQSHVNSTAQRLLAYCCMVYGLWAILALKDVNCISFVGDGTRSLRWIHFNYPGTELPGNVDQIPLKRAGRSHNGHSIGLSCRRSYGFVQHSKGLHAPEASTRRPRAFKLLGLNDDDPHRLLKQLSLDKETHFKPSLGRRCSLYRYFNITKDNVEKHLSDTMDEYEADMKAKCRRMPYVVDGNVFNGDYTNWKLPIPQNLASYEFEGLNPNALKTLAEQDSGVEPRFNDEMLSSIYGVLSEPDVQHAKNATEAMIDLYDEVGDYSYYETCRGKVIRKDFLEDGGVVAKEGSKEERETMHRVLSHPTMPPSYLDPENPAHRTGRTREVHRKSDCGRLQRLRWEMDIDSKDDIIRGEARMGNNITKEFIDSIEWEQPMPTYHDRNFYKRTHYEGGFGEGDRTPDSYFDIQFIGSTDAYPYAVSAGMQYAWPIYWVPMLRKKHPKRYGQPIRSPVFNLGGVEPIQLWFYPEGAAGSEGGFCALKVITPPGWCLPYRIYLFVFSEYNRVVVGPMYRESPEYITRSMNFCRLLDKSDKELVSMRENDKDYVILGPAGNVYVGVGIVDEPVRKSTTKHQFAYDWDEGDYDFNQWLKKQTADPDDSYQQDNVDRERTHSIWYESHKYRYVPDRHISRYWQSRYNKDLDWRQPTF